MGSCSPGFIRSTSCKALVIDIFVASITCLMADTNQSDKMKFELIVSFWLHFDLPG